MDNRNDRWREIILAAARTREAEREESRVLKKVPENHQRERFAYEEVLKILQYLEIVPGGERPEE
jgi:hypothetical protein